MLVMSRLIKSSIFILFLVLQAKVVMCVQMDKSREPCNTSKNSVDKYAISFKLSDSKKLEDVTKKFFKRIESDNIKDCRLMKKNYSDYISYVFRGREFLTKIETSFGGMTIVSVYPVKKGTTSHEFLKVSILRQHDNDLELVGNAELGNKSQLVSFKYENALSDKNYHKARKEISDNDDEMLKKISGDTIFVIVGDNIGYYHAIYYKYNYKEGYQNY